MFVKFHNKDSGLPVVVNINKIDAYYQYDKSVVCISVNGSRVYVDCSIIALEQIMQDNGYETEWEV